MSRDHISYCKLAVGFVRAGAIGSIFVRAGGWQCGGCADEKSDAILEHLSTVADGRILWLGELNATERSSAARQARRFVDAGRVIATRRAVDPLMLAAHNFTPRSRVLRPLRADVAIARFVDTVRFGPTPKRVDWADSWRPQPDKRTSDPAVRAGMGPADLWAAAVEAAGYRTGVRVVGVSDVEIAKAIDEQLEILRGERDGVAGWKHLPGQEGAGE